VETAEQVVYFGDMKLFGESPARGLSVLWHERERMWLVSHQGRPGWGISGVARAEVLRRFAEGALASLEPGAGENDITVFTGDRTSLEVLTGVDEDGPYLTIWAWFDNRYDFVGVGESGEPVFSKIAGTQCMEYHLDPVDPERLKGALRNLLYRLDATGPSKSAPPKSMNLITTFAKRGNDPSKTRLDIARRTGDGRWFVTLHPFVSRPVTDEAIRAFAEATQHILDTRSGERSTALLLENGYRLDVVVGAHADAFHVTASIRSPGPNKTDRVLDLDARFTPVGETQLRDMLKGLR
jgi:hypothetical protein